MLQKRIILHVAVNEQGDHCLSEVSAEDALRNLVAGFGGRAFRVVDVQLDILHASEAETLKRRIEAGNIRLVD